MSNAPFQSLLLDSNAELPEPPDPVCVPDQYYTCGPDGDPYWDSVVLMLHFDGVDGGTTFTDSSQYNASMTVNGVGSVTSTAQYKFGSSSYLGTNTSCIHVSSANNIYNALTGEFTVEFWAYRTAYINSRRLFSIIPSTNGPQLAFINAADTLTVLIGGSQLGSVSNFFANAGGLNTWVHIALVRSGTSILLFRNGQLVFTGGSSYNITNAQPVIGGFETTSTTQGWDGYIDDFRYTVGVARYTGNFTIPKEAYPDFREPSNQISPLIQTPGTTGWTVTNPSPLVHKAVAVSASSFYISAKFETTEFFGKRYVEFKVIGLGRSPNNDGTGYLFGLQQVGVPTVVNPFSNPSIGFSMYKLVGLTGFTVNGDAGNNNSAYTFNNGDVICFAYDSQTGRLWVRRNANAWIGGGDPVADTNPTQVINSKLQRPWVSVYNSTTGSSGTWEVEIVAGNNAVFMHTPPTGFIPFGGDYTFDPRTVLSLHADNDELDASCFQEKTITLTGTAEVSVEQVKFGTGAFKITNTGTSTVNGLQIRNHQDFNFGTQNFTLELWAYKLNHTYQNTLFFSSSLGGSTFSIITAATTGQITVTYRSSGGTQTASNLGVFPLNQWVFVTLQRRNNLWEFYINGTLVDTRAIFGGASSTVNSAADLFFGRTNVASTQTWNGYIDEIRITRGVARYNETILELIPNTAPHPLTVADDPYFNQVAALFEFEGANNGTVFTDSSINNVTVTVGGGFPVTSTADKKIGNSSLFSSSAGQINFSLPTNTNRTFTLEFWFKRIGTPNYAAFLEINSNTRVSLRTPLALGAYQFGILGSTLGEPDSIFTSDTVPQGVWTHLAVCYSAIGTNNGVLRLFIDGELKRTALRNIPAISGAINIGRSDDSGFNGFGGYIDSWRLTIGVARYVAPFDPNTLPNCDSTDPPVISTSGNERPVGQFVTVQRGSVTVQDPWVRLQGQQMTAARGNVTASIPDRTAALTGQQIAAITGNATVFSPNRTAAVIGQSVTLSRGNLAIAPYPNLTRISTSGAVAYIEALVPNNGFVCISYYPNGTIQQRYGILNQYLVLWSFSGTWINQNQGYNIVDIAGQYTMRPVTIFIGPPPTVTRTAPDIFMNTGVLPPLALPASMEEAIHFYWLGGSSYPKVQFAIRPAPNNPRYGETNYFHLFNYEHSFTVVQLSP